MKSIFIILVSILSLKANAQNIDSQYLADESQLIISSWQELPGKGEHWKDTILLSETLLQKDFKDSFTRYDFSPLWTVMDNDNIYGFIGPNYQRLQMKFISITKDKNRNDCYRVIGKSKVNSSICQFTGTITITNIKIFKYFYLGVDEMYRDSGIKDEGILIAYYNFKEDSTQLNSGIFKGTLATIWYIDKSGKLTYDNMSPSDAYCNNQFVGYWESYKSSVKLNCNWGDFRAPFSGDLDIGAGDFYPNPKYYQFGWQRTKNDSVPPEQMQHDFWWK